MKFREESLNVFKLWSGHTLDRQTDAQGKNSMSPNLRGDGGGGGGGGGGDIKKS